MITGNLEGSVMNCLTITETITGFYLPVLKGSAVANFLKLV